MPDHTIFNERPESQDRAISQLQAMGYQYIPRAEAEQKRGRLSAVVFPDVMKEFMSGQSFRYREKLTSFSDRSIYTAIRDLDVHLERGLMYAGKIIYESLLFGKSCEEELFDGGRQSFDLSYIDWEHPEKNIWQVTDEFSVERQNGKFARPDIVIFVNGIPLAVIECKKSGIDVDEGVKQNIRNWQSEFIPHLFKYVQLAIAMNPNEVKYGTAGTPQEFFSTWMELGKDNKIWRTDSAKRYTGESLVTEQDKAIVSLLSKERLLSLIRNYILYDNNIKKIARYQQFFGVENTMRRLKGEDGSSSRGGVIWHTQGSGKSLTMVMLTKRIIADRAIKNPRFVLVCDRLNLVRQLRDNFINTGMQPSEATTGKGLMTLLKNKGETIITSTINKFENAARGRTKVTDDNIFLLIDESHRSHTGEFHNMMNEVLPNAIKIGFTGTPLLKKNKNNTFRKFGELIGEPYRFEDGIRDGVIVPLVYEGRYIPQSVPNKKIDDYLKYILTPLNERQQEDMRQKWSRFLPLAQTEQRLAMIAFDIHEHFTTYCKPRGYKAMVAASSRPAAIDLQHAVNRLGGVRAAALICDEFVESEGYEGVSTTQNKQKIRDFFKNEVEPRFGPKHEDYEDYVKNNIVGGDDVDIVIVKDMLLTGFDAPPLGVLYVDKSMKDHTLLQAIARVNRVWQGKDFGLIVDYWGLFAKLNTALEMYSDTESGFSGFDASDLQGSIYTANEQKEALFKAYSALWAFFNSAEFERDNPRAWQAFFERDNEDEAVLLRKTFYEKLAAFSKLIGLAMGSSSLYELIGFDIMQKYKADLLFFQKLRAALMKIYAEKVEFSKYEDGIRSLLNTFVGADPVEISVEPVAIHDKAAMDKQLNEIDGQKAKAAYIRTRLVSELEARRYEDPLLFKRFSERIQETLAEYRTSRNENAYLASLRKMADNVREGFVGHTYPLCIDGDNDAKAFYGVVADGLKAHHAEPDESFDKEVGKLALEINMAIKSLARVDWRSSTAINKKMKQALDDLIWDFSDEHGLDLSPEEIDLFIENAMKTAMSRY
ncbi:MAG TPA: type I restriction endonuclease subunit R [Desulfitobacteriaceae bacterium]|nr:type I restriction endonuclease subunit R [Desulfitobacteriaceae bacterium]